MIILIILGIAMFVLLIMTYKEIKRIKEHSVTHKHKENTSKKEEEKTKTKISPLLIVLGIVFFGITTYLGYHLSSTFNLKKVKIKPLKQLKNTAKNNEKSNQTSNYNSENSADKKENNHKHVEESPINKFFTKYENIFGKYVTESGDGVWKKKNITEVISSKSKFEVQLKNNEVYKIFLTEPFRKEIYDMNSVNFDRTKKLIKRHNDYLTLMDPKNNSFFGLNEKVKSELINPDSFVYIKTEILEEKREYLITKLTYKEGSLKKTIRAKIYPTGKIILMN